ncbi:MAG: hypothetical protein ABSE89_06520 [Sedimentisphaerales bacterium]
MSNMTDEIKKIENRIADLKAKLFIEEKVLARLKAIQNPNRPATDSNGHRAFRQGSVASYIEAVLKETNKPMSIPELTTALEQRGVTSSSRSGLSPMIASVLSKTDTFIKVKRGVYALKGQQQELDL